MKTINSMMISGLLLCCIALLWTFWMFQRERTMEELILENPMTLQIDRIEIERNDEKKKVVIENGEIIHEYKKKLAQATFTNRKVPMEVKEPKRFTVNMFNGDERLLTLTIKNQRHIYIFGRNASKYNNKLIYSTKRTLYNESRSLYKDFK